MPPAKPIPGVYQKLGVHPVIHGAGTTTRYGGSLMRPETIAAMREPEFEARRYTPKNAYKVNHLYIADRVSMYTRMFYTERGLLLQSEIYRRAVCLCSANSGLVKIMYRLHWHFSPLFQTIVGELQSDARMRRAYP
jgi:hypothetical protein